jgi:DNA-directed RNA polymerase
LATKAEIHEQVELEREQIRQGLKQLHDNNRKLENKEYASASVYGVASIEQLLPLVVGRIQATNDRIRERKTGKSFKEIIQYLADIEPEAAAAIACKVTFDKVFSTKPNANKVQNVTDAIGQAVENECMMRHYERKVPGLLHTIKENYFHRSIGTHQKVKVITTLMNRYDVPHWKCWGISNRIKLGGWLLDCIIESSGWFTKELRREGRKTHTFIIPSTHFLSIKEEVMATAELFSPLAWPMLIEPNDWTNERQGGYLLNEVMRGYDMVRRGNNRLIQGETPIDFLNKIQKVGYTLNPFIVGVAETLLERGIQVGKFIPIVELPLPPKPYDIAENKEARHDYNRKAAEVHNTNAQAFQRSCRTRMTMNAVKVFKDKEKFFIPWSFDYRGRAYPIPAFLTPQDTDFGKSLLKFHEQSFMTPEAEQWLAFQVATTYGKDKDTMCDRLTWVAENHDLISRIAKDPIGNRPEWEGVEEPWTFLAACDEYYHCVIECDRTHTSLPVAVDATCSGLQILAGLARDASTARLVNVLPSDRPQDAYKVIAEQAKPHVPECIRPHMDRKTTKRTVMTVPYNAKPFSNRGYIREALKEKGVEVEKDDLTATVKAVRDAMNVIVPGPMSVMKWIESEVAAAIDHGAKELQWVTPSGFVVTQKLMKKKIEEIQLQLLGRCHIKIATEDGDKVDRSHHKNATAPNLIHSLDASLLHLSALRFDAPISLIHDSVLCRATDMSVLSAIVRETYMHLFAEHDYLKTFAQYIGAETEPPMCNTLEPASVIESTYFFC